MGIVKQKGHARVMFAVFDTSKVDMSNLKFPCCVFDSYGHEFEYTSVSEFKRGIQDEIMKVLREIKETDLGLTPTMDLEIAVDLSSTVYMKRKWRIDTSIIKIADDIFYQFRGQ